MGRPRKIHTPGETPSGAAQPTTENDDAPVSAAATAPVELPAGPQPVEGLRAADVDPNKIRRAVLTLDGWVCPAVAPGFGGER